MKTMSKIPLIFLILGSVSFTHTETINNQALSNSNCGSMLASTFLGGSDADDTYEPSIVLDKEGNVYISGFTSSHDFPTTEGAYRNRFVGGSRDRFVSKFNPDLSKLLASTYLGGKGEGGGIIGGNGDEVGHALAVDEEGNVYLAGYTESLDFPVTEGSFDESYNGGRDVFVSKFDGDLTTLIASTYIGGTGDEGFQWPRIDMTIDKDGNVYVAGITHSVDFPTTDTALDRSFNGGLKSGDGFLVKLDKKLEKMLASTFIGGSSNEWRLSVLCDENKSVIICGETESPDVPTTSTAYDRSAHRNGVIIKDIFISQFSPDLSTLLSSTYFGGAGLEEALDIRINAKGDIYVAGYTESKDFPTTQGAFNRKWSGGQRDLFVAKFDNDLSRLAASTLFGGSIRDMARGLALDLSGDVYVTGVTSSPDFPVTPNGCTSPFRDGSPYQRDAFVSKFSADLNTLLLSATFGGSALDDAFCIEIDGKGDVYIAGLTTSEDFPSKEESYDNSYNNGLNDCFIVKFNKNLSEQK
ncbi:SBBP repeat-containing protein [Acidobacteriota bacterium]